ncbi:MAG TPA: transposase, partial [Kineosporiaceae bacterium]
PLASWARSVAAVTLQVIKRTEAHAFKVVPRRWVVERTFGWLLRYRRLVRDYERRPQHHEVMVCCSGRRSGRYAHRHGGIHHSIAEGATSFPGCGWPTCRCRSIRDRPRPGSGRPTRRSR